MAAQAFTKEEVIDRLNALSKGDDSDKAKREAICLLTDALLVARMSDVVNAYHDARARIS